jgi:mono/diheme cytochrome c family protein
VRSRLLILVLAALALGARLYTRPAAPQVIRAASPAAVPATGPERGRLVYLRYGCAMCHGDQGKGGFANPNAETEGKVPGVIYVAEGYTRDELRRLIRAGTPHIGKKDPNGPTPPYRMPGWGDRMTEAEVGSLVEYLFSLYPKSAEEKWR